MPKTKLPLSWSIAFSEVHKYLNRFFNLRELSLPSSKLFFFCFVFILVFSLFSTLGIVTTQEESFDEIAKNSFYEIGGCFPRAPYSEKGWNEKECKPLGGLNG